MGIGGSKKNLHRVDFLDGRSYFYHMERPAVFSGGAGRGSLILMALLGSD